ncbi:MAG: PAS domain-containing protein, partial [Chthoniobacterales bacterium]
MVALIGLTKLAGILCGWDLGVDRWLFASQLPDSLRFPNRMSPNTAFNFLLLGGALLFVEVKSRSVRFWSEFSVVLVGFGSLLAVLAYAYDVQSFYGFNAFTPMALHTAITFSVLAVAFLLSHTDSGLLAILAGDSTGGTLARRLLPAAVLVPAVFGWLSLQGEEAGIFHGQFSHAVFAVGNILIFTFLVCWSTNVLSSADLGRKKAEEALRQSEEQFRAMFELASVGIAQADPRTGQWVRVNQKMCEITGYSAGELLQMRVPDITHPEDRQSDREKFERVVRGEAPDYRMEKRYIRKDGALAWVNVNMTVIRDAGGQPTRTMAAIEDITERKVAEAKVAGLQKQLVDASRQAGMAEIATNVLHNVGNVLNSVNISTGL